MDKQAYENHKAFAGAKVASMKRRCVEHDYCGRRIYMVTLVVEGRRPLLGRVVGDVRAGCHSAEGPRTEPSALGAAVARVWESIPEHHPGVELLGLQLMPDHLHGILFVTRPIPEGLGKVILGFKQACNKEYRRLGGQGAPVAVAQQQTPPPAGAAAGQAGLAAGLAGGPAAGAAGVVPAAVAQQQTLPAAGAGAGQAGQAAGAPVQAQRQRQQHTGHEAGLLFEREYNDSILVREGQLEAMKRYLAENPYRLAMKRARPEWLRVRQGVPIGRWLCSAVGNMQLLKAERRLQVRVSRSIDPGVLAVEMERLLRAARGGAVLVSPSISPGEKAIMRAAFDEGLSLVVVVSNGFEGLQKPSGERFHACAEGRLLLLSPFAHTNNRTHITREACETLNALAWAICR